MTHSQLHIHAHNYINNIMYDCDNVVNGLYVCVWRGGGGGGCKHVLQDN